MYVLIKNLALNLSKMLEHKKMFFISDLHLKIGKKPLLTLLECKTMGGFANWFSSKS